MTTPDFAPWMTPEEEARNVRDAAARGGCVVRSMRLAPTLAGQRAIAHVSCPDGWAAARMLLGLCAGDARTAGARDLALELRGEAPSDVAFAMKVHRFVLEHAAFVREHGEVFAGPSYTLVARGGDCDDHVRLTYAILAAGGLPVRLAFLYTLGDMGGPSHVVAQVQIAGRWCWVETTVPAAFGEHPLAAAVRVGILSSRGDIAQEVRTMSESDLPPVPSGFDDRNPPELVAIDAAGLASLGFLSQASSRGLTADAPAFRRAVAQFQADWGLPVDGLIGPLTRGKLREALARTGNIGAIVPRATKDLSDAFFEGVAAMARDFRAKGATVSGEDFLAVWLSESGVNSHCQGAGCGGPTAKFSDFGGLNMMNTESRRGAGFPDPGNAGAWVALEAEEQLPFVRRFYEANVAAFCGGRFACLRDVGSLYLMNFTPAFMSHADDPSFVIAAANGPNPIVYQDNAGIDAAKKGAILVSDMAPFALRATRANPARWAELQARIRAVGEPPLTPPPAPGGTGTLVAGAVALAVLGALWRFYT